MSDEGWAITTIAAIILAALWWGATDNSSGSSDYPPGVECYAEFGPGQFTVCD